MLKLIKADLYKLFHRMYLYVFMVVMAGCAVFYNAVLASAHLPREGAFQSVLGLLIMPLFFVVMFADIVTAEENKERTLKNAISFGISRNKLYIAKNITAVIIATVVAAVTLLVFFGSGFILMSPGPDYSLALMSDILLKIAVAFLLYIAGIVLGTTLAIVIKRNSLFTFAYFGILVVPLLVFKLLTLVSPVFSHAQYVMLITQANALGKATPAQILITVWVALAHIAVFGILGLILFKRQEINS